jgi:hypothetical protein
MDKLDMETQLKTLLLFEPLSLVEKRTQRFVFTCGKAAISAWPGDGRPI